MKRLDHDVAGSGIEPDGGPPDGRYQKSEDVEADGCLTLALVIEELTEDGCREGKKSDARQKEDVQHQKDMVAAAKQSEEGNENVAIVAKAARAGTEVAMSGGGPR